MKTITIQGSNDDIILVDGGAGFSDEFYFLPDDNGQLAYLSFSDGTVLSFSYWNDGVWRVHRVRAGAAKFSKDACMNATDERYSDIVTLEGDIDTVVFGVNIMQA